MSDELREAAELITQSYGPSFEHNARKLAAACLAEHPADDQEPVTETWLRRIGSQEVDGVGRHCWGFGLFAHVAIGLDGSLTLKVDKHRITLVKRIATRGDVRLLCKALGIGLKEGKVPS